MFTSVHKFSLNNEFVQRSFYGFLSHTVQHYKVFALNYFPLNNSIWFAFSVGKCTVHLEKEGSGGDFSLFSIDSYKSQWAVKILLFIMQSA